MYARAEEIWESKKREFKQPRYHFKAKETKPQKHDIISHFFLKDAKHPTNITYQEDTMIKSPLLCLYSVEFSCSGPIHLLSVTV